MSTAVQEEKTLEQFGYKQELKRSLSVWDLIIYGLIFMVPIAPFGIYGFVADTSKGMVALAYLIGMVGMIFTAFSYARMSEAFPISGSVYAYANLGLHETVGFFAGWAILLDYVLVPALLYIVSGAALSAFIPQVPVFVWATLFIIINTVINILGIEFTAKFNKVVLVLELIVLAVFLVVGVVAVINGVNGSQVSVKPIYDSGNFSMGLVMAAVSLAVLSFLGFDGISTLAEETRGGFKTVGTATVASLLIVGVLFILQTSVAAWVMPDFKAFSNLDTAFYQVAETAGGKWLMITCSLATAFAWGIANSLAAQAAVSRVIFSMSRDGNLPRLLAKVHSRFKTPYVATLFIAVLTLVITFIFSSRIADITSLVNFGALTAFLLLHVTVVYYYIIRKKSKKYVRHLLFPVLGFIVIAYVWLNLDISAKTLGAIWIGIGIIYYLVLLFAFRRKPAKLDV